MENNIALVRIVGICNHLGIPYFKAHTYQANERYAVNDLEELIEQKLIEKAR